MAIFSILLRCIKQDTDDLLQARNEGLASNNSVVLLDDGMLDRCSLHFRGRFGTGLRFVEL